ncbi:MAG: hypothetical protein Tsb0020_45830 [Haliangiales bacterium]
MTKTDGTPQPIELVSYQPAWADEFLAIARPLRASLGDNACRIDHIGSTSIPGLGAKPIIDIQVSVDPLEPMAYLGDLQALGYVWRRHNPDLSKRYFREGAGQRRTHIHVRQRGSWHEQLSLLFRDYVRAHPEARATYESEKQALARRFANDRAAYTDAKGPVIWQLLYRANQWAQTTGWTPGASDA